MSAKLKQLGMNVHTWALLLLALPCLAASGSARAALSAPCVEGVQRVGSLQVEVHLDVDGNCSFLISPAQAFSLTFRDYLFDNQGSFMVFNSVPGNEATSAGARSYFFFPRKGMPSYQFLTDGRLQVVSASGQSFFFSSQTTLLDSIPGVTYKEDPQISMTNAGGVEISNASGVWLDSGWQIGAPAYQNPSKHSVFHDGSGHSCEVVNSSIFTYKDLDPIFDFAQDRDLAVFLKTACPTIDVGVLED